MDSISERVKDFDAKTYTSYELVELSTMIDDELMAREREEDARLQYSFDFEEENEY